MAGPDPTGHSGAARRPVRSFVLRGGRLTSGQSRALERLWPRFGIEHAEGDEPLHFLSLFGRQAPVIVEIGFGNGEATWQTARAHPEQDFIGVEVHRPGVGRLLMALEEHELGNVRIACQDAVGFMGDAIPESSLDGVRIYFPDPWPKKRHHKRRIVQAPFMALVARCIKPGGILHLATDWAPYAEHMLEVLGSGTEFTNLSKTGDFCPRPEWRPGTRYERRGERLGHRVYDLLYKRQT
jgi:tRNA (guanine-N7-)-methyltransferase